MVLHEGQVAEMGTGEGKTLVAVLAAYLNALPPRGGADGANGFDGSSGSSGGGGGSSGDGRSGAEGAGGAAAAGGGSGGASGSGGAPLIDGGVHVVTVNDYLAARDAEWMGRVYRCAFFACDDAICW